MKWLTHMTLTHAYIGSNPIPPANKKVERSDNMYNKILKSLNDMYEETRKEAKETLDTDLFNESVGIKRSIKMVERVMEENAERIKSIEQLP